MKISQDYLTKKITIYNILPFIRDLYKSGKLIEIFSFAFWEIKYRWGLFKNSEIIQFNNPLPVCSVNQTNYGQLDQCTEGRLSKSQHNWWLCFIHQHYQTWGCFNEHKNILIKLDVDGILISKFTFPEEIKSIFVTTSAVFICSGGVLYRSGDDGLSFKQVLQLSTPISFFRKDAMTETPVGVLYFGEYANLQKNENWVFVGYIYTSSDQGLTWQKNDFLQKKGINKHIHLLMWSNVINGLVLTDGDNQKNMWIMKSDLSRPLKYTPDDFGWQKINRFHVEKGGYTAIAELNDCILLGTDYHGGTNFLVTIDGTLRPKARLVPNPYRRAIFERIVVIQETQKPPTIYANLQFSFRDDITSLVMYSLDKGATWHKLIDYNGTEFEIKIISKATTDIPVHFLRVFNKLNGRLITYEITSPKLSKDCSKPASI